jgi:hypothetical protein
VTREASVDTESLDDDDASPQGGHQSSITGPGDSNSVGESASIVRGLNTPPPMTAADDVPRYETGDDGSYPRLPIAPPLASPSGVSDGGPGPSIEGSPRSPTDNHRSLPVTQTDSKARMSTASSIEVTRGYGASPDMNVRVELEMSNHDEMVSI